MRDDLVVRASVVAAQSPSVNRSTVARTSRASRGPPGGGIAPGGFAIARRSLLARCSGLCSVSARLQQRLCQPWKVHSRSEPRRGHLTTGGSAKPPQAVRGFHDEESIVFQLVVTRTLETILALRLTVAWASDGRCEPSRLDWWQSNLIDAASDGDERLDVVPGGRRAHAS